jgi:DNA mismatch repair protein MSH2
MSSRPELKVEDEQGFIRCFRSLPATTDETIRIFDRTEYYTAHGENAVFIAKTVYRSTSVLRQLGRSPGLDSVTLSKTVFRNFLREALFRLGKRIEVYENTGRNVWKICKQVYLS